MLILRSGLVGSGPIGNGDGGIASADGLLPACAQACPPACLNRS